MKSLIFALAIIYTSSSFAQDHTKQELLVELERMKVSIQIGKMFGEDQAYRFSGAVLAKKGIQWDEISNLPEYQKGIGKNDWQPKPIENIELIDKLRAEMDMPSFKEYVEEVRKFCL